MNRWLATLSFKENPTPEVQALIPAEQARVKELMAQGLIEAFYISNTAGKAWMVLRGDSASEVKGTLATLPMHNYFAQELDLLSV